MNPCSQVLVPFLPRLADLQAKVVKSYLKRFFFTSDGWSGLCASLVCGLPAGSVCLFGLRAKIFFRLSNVRRALRCLFGQ